MVIAYFALMLGCLEMRVMANAPDCEISASGSILPLGMGSLYSGMKRVLYLPGTERIPRQLPPFIRGPFPSARASAKARFISATMDSEPCFSSSPPGIRRTDHALSYRAMSASVLGIPSAGITTTKRSIFSGRD